jgi:hypothetical protein
MNHRDMAHIIARAHLDAMLAMTPEKPTPSNVCPYDDSIMVYEKTQGNDVMMRCRICNHYKVVEA